MKFDKLDEPLNLNERYMYGINLRLNVLIDMFSSFLDVYAEEGKVSTTKNIIEDEPIKEEVIEEEVKETMDFTVLTKKELKDILDHCDIEYDGRSNKDTLVTIAEENIK